MKESPASVAAFCVDAAAAAYALAAQEAYALAMELTRRSQSLLAAAPKLRAKGAGRVVELLLSDDAVSPARAAKLARLSDRAARRLFDRLAGKEISRDVIGRLKRLDLIDGALRAPEPGAPFAYVTTRKFLEVFGLANLRDLPDIERLEDAGLLQRPANEIDLDGALGLVEDDGQAFEGDREFEGAELEDTTDDA
jgi:hypothetical protein